MHNSKRIDELEKYYRPIERLDKLDSAFFWGSAILSVVVLYENSIPWPQLRDLPSILFVTSVIINLAFSLYLRFHLMPLAARVRRRQLLSDSFNVPLTSETTQNYYNNDLLPSVAKLAANVLENTLFAKTISTTMANKERFKVLIYFIVWILAVFWRSTDLGFLVIITQTLFSGEIIEKWLRLELLRHSNEEYYNELYSNFLHEVDLGSASGIASVLETFAAYEATKALAGIKMSSSIFNNINQSLSAKWVIIREQLELDKRDTLN